MEKADVKSFDSSVLIAKPQPSNDHCDSMLLLKVPCSTVAVGTSPEEEIVLVFKEASKTEENKNNEVWVGHFAQGSQKSYHQYCKFCDAVSTISDEDLAGDNGYLRALKDGRFLYVYVTTPSVYLTSEDLVGSLLLPSPTESWC